MTSPFVRFGCGCIGLMGQHKPIIIESCRRDAEGLSFYYGSVDERNLVNPQPLTQAEEQEVVRVLGNLVWRGHQLTHLQLVLQQGKPSDVALDLWKLKE